MKKSVEEYKSVSKDNKYLIPAVLMIIYIAIALLITVSVKSAMGSTDEVVTIAANAGENAFYNGKYDAAISEYAKLQEKEEWPIYNLKIAEIYSIQGDYKKSNEFIQKAYEVRNKLVDTKNADKQFDKEKDKEILNYIIFTYFMNGEYKKSLEYGELSLIVYPNDKNLLNTMFMVYMANEKSDKAKEIIARYPSDDNDYEDLIDVSRMNMLIGNYDEGFNLLKKAWENNKDNIEVFDVIEELASNDKDGTIKKISKLAEKDKNESIYKMWMAKVYSMDHETFEKAQKLIDELEDENSGNVNLELIKYSIEEDEDTKEDILSDLIDDNEDTFIGYYLSAMKSYDNKRYDDALKNAKKSILEDKTYYKTYIDLIPKILIASQKKTEAEPYFRTAIYEESFNYNNMIKTAEYYKDTLGDNNKATSYYELASKINSTNPEIYYNIALIKINNQRESEAVDLLKKSISLNDKCAKYYRTLGNAYLKENKNDEGIKAIRSAYSIDDKDILTLNNAAYYYASVESDIDRAMTNIKAAYDGITDKTNELDKKTITDNYNRIKTIYDSGKKNSGNSLKSSATELKLI